MSTHKRDLRIRQLKNIALFGLLSGFGLLLGGAIVGASKLAYLGLGLFLLGMLLLFLGLRFGRPRN